jgi:hypothetical protein
MKIKELIDLLQKEDPDMRIVLDGYEEGFDELHIVKHIRIGEFITDEDKPWWKGEFKWSKQENETEEMAIYFPRGGKKLTNNKNQI